MPRRVNQDNLNNFEPQKLNDSIRIRVRELFDFSKVLFGSDLPGMNRRSKMPLPKAR